MGVFQEAWRPFQLCRLQPVYKSCTISRYCIKNFSLQKIGETLASIVPVFKKVYPWCQNCTLYLFWSLLWPYRSSNNEGHTIKLWRVCPMRGWVMREWFLSITKFGNLPSKQRQTQSITTDISHVSGKDIKTTCEYLGLNNVFTQV